MRCINKLWILHNPSGLSLFEQTFEDLEGDADPCVVAGFLFAIAKITQNITQQDIEFIQMHELRFSFLVQQQYMIIIVSPNDTKTSHLTQIITQIQAKFEKKYLKSLTPVFSGNVSQFKTFASEIETIVQQNAKYFQFVDRRNENIKDIFQAKSNDWISLKNALEKKSSSMGSWIIKEENPISKELSSHITETREFEREKQISEETTPKSKSKRFWV